ncbi:MAG: DUF2809 domain-containing protein [Cyclobacteriaceae bacterium]
MLTFRKKYFAWAVLLFIIEVLIALYVRDAIIRPYVGDILVVIMLYCFIRAFLLMLPGPVALFTLLFAYLVEFLQYLNLLSFLGLEDSRLARIILGSSFEWIDMLAYTLGVLVIYLLDRKRV